MPEIKPLQKNYRMWYMQIRYKILKVKDVYEKFLKEVTSDSQNC